LVITSRSCSGGKNISPQEPLVIAGDFNIDVSRQTNLNEFAQFVSSLGVRRVPVHGNLRHSIENVGCQFLSLRHGLSNLSSEVGYATLNSGRYASFLG
jgi:hypothetical protein